MLLQILRSRFGLFLVFGLSLFFVLFSSHDSFALSDTYVFNSSNLLTQYFSFCSNSRTPCSSYNYLIITNDTPSVLSYNGLLSLSFQTSDYGQISSNLSTRIISSNIYEIPSNIISLGFGQLYSSFTNWENAGGQLTVTITDTFPSDCPAGPSGSLSITENGTYDVSSYSEAVVDVPPDIIYGDYHDDLVSINNTIMIIPAVALVIYFFFCIYRMLLRSRS